MNQIADQHAPQPIIPDNQTITTDNQNPSPGNQTQSSSGRISPVVRFKNGRVVMRKPVIRRVLQLAQQPAQTITAQTQLTQQPTQTITAQTQLVQQPTQTITARQTSENDDTQPTQPQPLNTAPQPIQQPLPQSTNVPLQQHPVLFTLHGLNSCTRCITSHQGKQPKECHDIITTADTIFYTCSELCTAYKRLKFAPDCTGLYKVRDMDEIHDYIGVLLRLDDHIKKLSNSNHKKRQIVEACEYAKIKKRASIMRGTTGRSRQLQKRIEAYIGETAQLTQQNEYQRAQITQLTQQNAQLTQQNAQLTQQNAQLTQQTAQLTQQLEEKNNHNSLIPCYESTASSESHPFESAAMNQALSSMQRAIYDMHSAIQGTTKKAKLT